MERTINISEISNDSQKMAAQTLAACPPSLKVMAKKLKRGHSINVWPVDEPAHSGWAVVVNE